MNTTTGREELIARLEKEGPSSELDREIARSFETYPTIRFTESVPFERLQGMYWVIGKEDTPDGPIEKKWSRNPPLYTRSIDAALTLVPDEHTWNAGITDEHYGGPLIATAQVLTREHTPEGWRARGVNPAIALCTRLSSLSAKGETGR